MYRFAWSVVLAVACSAPPRHDPIAPVTPVLPDAAPISDGGIADAAAIVAAPVPEPAPPPFEPTAFEAVVRGHGRPIILIPGLGCPPSVWDSTVAHLGDTVETHTLSLSGFAGRAPIDAPLNATVRAELATYIRDRKLERPVVIGHSLGGFITYWLAAVEPELVGPVIIVDSAPQMFGDTLPSYTKARGERWRRMTGRQFTTAVREYFGTMAHDPVKLSPVITAVAQSDRRTFVDAFVEMAAVDIRPLMGKITAPVLSILAQGEAFAALVTRQSAPIRDHRITVLPRTRHFVFFDDPKGYFRAIDEFLAAHPHVAAEHGKIAP